MREEDSSQLRRRELQENKAQILDDWIQNPTENILLHLPRRSGASTLLHQAVETHAGFHIHTIRGQGFEYIVSEQTGNYFGMGTPTRGEMNSFVNFRYLCAV